MVKDTRDRTEYKKKQYQEWCQTRKHPCIDCGKPCCPESLRCNSCQLKIRWKTHPIINPVFFAKGKDHYNWKGGRVNLGGYVGIYNPSHPRANIGRGYVFEHILVWEKIHGKPVPKGWIIHHLNGIKSDNRPANLQVLPNKKHFLLLEAKAKRIQELEALLNNQPQLV